MGKLCRLSEDGRFWDALGKEVVLVSMRFWVPLVGMTLSTFVFNTSEFMPIGLLTDIAADFNMTESAAGMLISVYAWAVMILSLPLMLCVTKVPPKRLLLGVIVLFGICQLLSAASVNFWMLMAARIGVAAAHAVFWSSSLRRSRCV